MERVFVVVLLFFFFFGGVEGGEEYDQSLSERDNPRAVWRRAGRADKGKDVHYIYLDSWEHWPPRAEEGRGVETHYTFQPPQFLSLLNICFTLFFLQFQLAHKLVSLLHGLGLIK